MATEKKELVGAFGEEPGANKIVGGTRKQGETPEEFKLRMAGGAPSAGPNQVEQILKLLDALNQGQIQTLKQLGPGQVNPVTGTRSTVRLNMDGSREDPNAPQGLAWIEANGPNRDSVQARKNQMDLASQTQAQAGYDAVQAKKAEQAGQPQTAWGNNPQNPDRVQTSGGQTVAYRDGQPVGFRGDMPNTPSMNGQPIGGFTKAELPSAWDSPFVQRGAAQAGSTPLDPVQMERIQQLGMMAKANPAGTRTQVTPATLMDTSGALVNQPAQPTWWESLFGGSQAPVAAQRQQPMQPSQPKLSIPTYDPFSPYPAIGKNIFNSLMEMYPTGAFGGR